MAKKRYVKVEFDGYVYEKEEGVDSMYFRTDTKTQEDLQGYQKVLFQRGLPLEEVKKKLLAFLEQY